MKTLVLLVLLASKGDIQIPSPAEKLKPNQSTSSAGYDVWHSDHQIGEHIFRVTYFFRKDYKIPLDKEDRRRVYARYIDASEIFYKVERIEKGPHANFLIYVGYIWKYDTITPVYLGNEYRTWTLWFQGKRSGKAKSTHEALEQMLNSMKRKCESR